MSARLVIASGLPGAGGELATAAATAVAGAAMTGGGHGGVLLIELGGERRRAPTLLASASARRLEEALRADGLTAAARGAVCWAPVPAREGEELDELRRVLRAAGDDAWVAVACLPGRLWRPALCDERLRVAGGLLRAALPDQRALAALAVRELVVAGVRARIADRAPGAVASRRALSGLDPGGATGARAARLARGLLAPRPARPVQPLAEVGPPGPGPGRIPIRGVGRGPSAAARSERGQALPLLLGGAVAIVISALLLVAIGGAVTGTARGQRLADLAAISAARSMRDDHPRLFAPARLPDGRANPRHLAQRRYLDRAAAAARDAARRNGADPGRIRVRFPDRDSFAPLRVRVELVAQLEPRGSLAEAGTPAADNARAPEVVTAAEAAAVPAVGPEAGDGHPAADAEPGDYAGPLVSRQGKPMRPDVARAFDRLAASARTAGVALVVSSAYRSSAEQARLFARNPDPRWVAPPGRSLHRCGTELDLGPPTAHAWLAANAPRFGFVRRYQWEPWHFGYEAGPPPCSRAGDRIGTRAGHGDGRLAARGLPGYVPVRFRKPIAAAASRHGVSTALLAAQLLAESNFNPFAVSPAGARGIAQFMPGTAAAYGLRDPFDPAAAIDAQARLMADLLAQFGSTALALAAYNAGPGPVSACACVPPYPETQGYVARILGLLDGAGERAAPPLEVRLVD